MRSIALSLVGLCVMPGSALAYRTFADLPQLAQAEGEPVAWQSFPITLEVAIDERAPVSTAKAMAAVNRATELWNDAMCTQAAFEPSVASEFAGSNDGYNTVQWVHGNWSGFSASNVVAVTEPVYEVVGGRYVLVEADIFLNAETVMWTDDLAEHLDGVLAHELGHVLGLAHPCEPDGKDGAPTCEVGANTLMHPLYDPARAMLTSDDEGGSCFLYPEVPRADPPKSESGAGSCAVAGGKHAASDGFVFALFSTALAWLARRRVRRA